jgi:hypothetical protein
MFVITVDQRGSRRAPDHVPELLSGLPAVPGVVRAAERTVGDEVQAVLADAGGVVELVLHVLRLGEWSVGVGAGPVEEPLPPSTREARGDAFVLARAAVEAAKSRNRSVPIAVRGADATAAADAEAVLTLVGAVAARRSDAGWEAIDQVRAADDERAPQVADGEKGPEAADGERRPGAADEERQPQVADDERAPDERHEAEGAPAGGTVARQEAVARRLGISQQAVSQRLRAALWAEELAARPAAARLLVAAQG